MRNKHEMLMANNVSLSKFIKASLAILTVFSGLIASGIVDAKDVPEPFTINEIETMYREVDNLIEASTPAEREASVRSFIEKARVERGKRYEDAVIKVQSRKASASMGTRVNFTTERKNIPFSIKPPFNGLMLKTYAAEPLVEVKRGSKSRVEQHKAVADKVSGTVNYSLTLVEPNLSEKDVHVLYWAWVEYEYSSAAALAAAVNDFDPVVKYAEERLEGALRLDKAALEAEAERLKKEADSDFKAAKLAPIEDGPSADQNKIYNFIVIFVSGIILPLIVHLIVWLTRNWWERRRK